MGRRKSYDKEFKLEAIKLVAEGSRTISSVARELDISKSTVSIWVKEHEEHKELAFPGKGNLRPEDAELRMLKRKVFDLEEENAILKKATAIFAKHQK
jgi:transposase